MIPPPTEPILVLWLKLHSPVKNQFVLWKKNRKNSLLIISGFYTTESWHVIMMQLIFHSENAAIRSAPFRQSSIRWRKVTPAWRSFQSGTTLAPAGQPRVLRAGWAQSKTPQEDTHTHTHHQEMIEVHVLALCLYGTFYFFFLYINIQKDVCTF